MNDPLLRRLAEVVGGDQVITDADVRSGYELDWTGRYRGVARGVVRPASTAEVAAVVAACAEAGVPIVTQGGNTGLVGGGVPTGGEVLVSLRRLNWLDPVDDAASQISAGAGVTIGAVQQAARLRGLDLAVDWGARDSATVGGAVATNAGGSRVVRFGTMRAQVAGIEAVLADGRIVAAMRGLPKTTTGVHLPSLFSGSEGTLAIITAARLRLVPWYRATAGAWLGFDSLADAVAALPAIRAVANLDAVELLTAAAVDVVAAAFGLRPPSRPPVAVLVEAAAHHDPTAELTDALADYDGVIAVGAQHDHLRQIRDHVSLAINSIGVPLKLDVAVPLDELQRLIDVAEQAAAHADLRLIPFGHLAEGNLHLNYVGPQATDPATAAQVAATVLGHVIEVGGAISAEHGIGRAKTKWVERLAGYEVQLALKRALDPANLLNPGVLHLLSGNAAPFAGLPDSSRARHS